MKTLSFLSFNSLYSKCNYFNFNKCEKISRDSNIKRFPSIEKGTFQPIEQIIWFKQFTSDCISTRTFYYYMWTKWLKKTKCFQNHEYTSFSHICDFFCRNIETFDYYSITDTLIFYNDLFQNWKELRNVFLKMYHFFIKCFIMTILH